MSDLKAKVLEVLEVLVLFNRLSWAGAVGSYFFTFFVRYFFHFFVRYFKVLEVLEVLVLFNRLSWAGAVGSYIL
jgi:hypothetical protein